MSDIKNPHGVSTLEWSEERIKQLDDLTVLLNIVATLNRGNRFLESCQQAIELADLLTARPSFITWLRQACAERK